MSEENQRSPLNDVGGPVAVGGVGGSGTRVIASMVQSLGYRIGTNLTRAQDDLSFSVLFKRPDFYPDVRGLVPADHPLARASAGVFARVRTGHRGLRSEVLPMARASLSLPVNDGQQGSSGWASGPCAVLRDCAG